MTTLTWEVTTEIMYCEGCNDRIITSKNHSLRTILKDFQPPTPGVEECDNDLFACDDNESPIPASAWKNFFETSSASKYMRLQPFPKDAW